MRILTLLAIFAAGFTGCSPQPAGEPPRQEPAASPPKIIQFYASSGEVPKGESVLICYGVESAKSVRIEPEVAQLSPSINRCFEVTPEKTTTYTLSAVGTEGETVSESFTVKVGGRVASAPASQNSMIRFFATSSAEIGPGQTSTLCYGVTNARSVTVEPFVQPLKLSDRSCFIVRPAETTTYTLTATARDGHKEQAQITVTVK